MKEKIQKVLARAGIASRRKIEEWIAAGRVVVNGEAAHVGQRVSHKDKIEVDGQLVGDAFEQDQTRVLLYHKPEGQICTRDDPEGRETVFNYLPRLQTGRWISVGRLDINTSGLLLFTNDGELANQLMHPSSEIEREYAVRVMGEVTEDMAVSLTNGIELDDGPARFEHIISQGGGGVNRWYHVVTMEGRHRVVRRLFEAVGLRVSRLTRVRFGPFGLPREVRPKRWMELDESTIEELRLFLLADSD